MDNLSAIATARDEGKEEGLAEGKLEERKLPWNMARSKLLYNRR